MEDHKQPNEEVLKKPVYKQWWFWVLIAVVVIGVIGSLNGGNQSLPDYDPVQSLPPQQTADEGAAPTAAPAATAAPTPEVNAGPGGEDLPADYRNALQKAKIYSDTLHMSKQGIYDQLVSEYGEKFPVDAAQYAIDHLDVDYKANALEKAKTYSETLHMSKQGIYDQLISEYGEKFTPRGGPVRHRQSQRGLRGQRAGKSQNLSVVPEHVQAGDLRPARFRVWRKVHP